MYIYLTVQVRSLQVYTDIFDVLSEYKVTINYEFSIPHQMKNCDGKGT